MPAARAALPVVVLVSGQGSNLQAILDNAARLGYTVRAVLSDRAAAPALDRARAAAVPAEVVDPAGHPGRAAYDAALMAAIDRRRPGLVALAGFMRVLGPEFVRHYRDRLLNIHPSLLPRHRGLHTHRRVLEAGDTSHGCSVHLVTEELDAGTVLAQAEVPVKKTDDETALRVRVQAMEHVIYPEVIGWIAAGRLVLKHDGVTFDGAPLSVPRIFPWKQAD